jgi:hypothetical protein
MSVYSSDPFVWEKEQASRAWPETAWFLEPDLYESVCGSVQSHLSVCLHGGICKYTAGTASLQVPGVSLPQRKRDGYKCVPTLEFTTE